MLQKITENTWGEYVDYAYELALCPEKTSYPVYYDGIKTNRLIRAGRPRRSVPHGA